MEEPKSSPSPGSAEGLHQLLIRLEHQALQPDFHLQRQLALSRALEPYLNPNLSPPLLPLPEEEDLARWFLYADYFPTDGHASLIEQVRDLVTEHVPEEERVWLDAFRHSYMDLLEVQEVSSENDVLPVRLQSLGDQQVFQALLPKSRVAYHTGQILLTRLIRRGADIRSPGPPLVLSANMGKMVLELTNDMRREIEIGTGNFALAEWTEFAKSYGYMMIWNVAKVRRGAWAIVDSQIDYVNTKGDIFLYAIALYEHHDFRLLTEGLNDFEQLASTTNAGADPSASGSEHDMRTWVWLSSSETAETSRSPVARITITPTQLYVETDSPERLDKIKHQLAAVFGFSLHFRGETTDAPHHTTPEVDLLADNYTVPPTVVPQEEEQQILASFLESVYIDWAETSSPMLKGESPRHYCTIHQDTKRVASIIDQMEHHDLGFRRTGHCAYDYNVLRAHIGL